MMKSSASFLARAAKKSKKTTPQIAAFQAQQAKTAALVQSFHEETPFDDVAGRAYAAPAPAAAQPAMIPETTDPMVALVAASVDMQQRQTDQMRAAAETQMKQHQETIKAMTDALEFSRQSQRSTLESVRREMNSRKKEEMQALKLFGEQQRKYLRTSLANHTLSEKKRLDEFRKSAEAVNRKKLNAQELRFTRSVGRVSETLSQHAEGMKRLLGGLRQQQEVTKSLKDSIEHKAAAALSSKNAAQKATVTAIQAVGASLKREQSKAASAVAAAVENKNRHQTQALKTTLAGHQSAQKNLMKSSFKSHQQSQLKGLAAAVASQKQQQSSQLATLREALAARQRLTGNAPLSTIPASANRFISQ